MNKPESEAEWVKLKVVQNEWILMWTRTSEPKLQSKNWKWFRKNEPECKSERVNLNVNSNVNQITESERGSEWVNPNGNQNKWILIKNDEPDCESK